MKIKTQELRQAIRAIVERKMLGESTVVHFMAARTLKLAAQQAALDFEKQIVKEMGLLDPNAMDDTSQNLYHQVMTKMQASVANAVVEAVKQLSSLPRNETASGGTSPARAA